MSELDAIAKRVPAAVDTPARACTTVYHDGSCPLCQREIALARKVTEGVTFVDVSLVGTGALGGDLTADVAMRRFHVRRADGQLISGAAAFLEMWRQSPRLRWLEHVAKRPAIVAVLDRVYSAFLHIRPSLARMLKPLKQ